MSNKQSLMWPPAYTLRRKAWIRSVRLQICAQRGLLLTVPKLFNLNTIDSVLAEHRGWIEKTWLRIQPKIISTDKDFLPTSLELHAIDKTWEMASHPSDNARVWLQQLNDQQLLICGKVSDPQLVKLALQHWTRQKAKKHLIPWLQKLSLQTGLNFSTATIRDANTRWGSCSASKRISLNYKLIFLPAPLVEYVILHELCHLVHLNHSADFWGLLKTFSPDCIALRKELRNGHRYIPSLLC